MFTLFNVRAASTLNKVNTATSTEDLAQATGALSDAAANLATRIRRIPRRAYHPRDPEERAAVKAELRKRDLTIREIVAEMGCSIATVHRIIKAAESTPTEQD